MRLSLVLVGGLLFLAVRASTACADPSGSDWRVVFADEFSGTTVDTVKWATQYEWGPTHNHQAYMEANNVVIDNGVASLVATRETAPNGMPFTSGVLSSHGTFRVSEGYIEARIKMPSNRGSWPAFWMLRSGWPPEIDIMEYPLFTTETTNDTYSVNNFWPGTGPPSDFLWVDRNIDLSAAYHNYGLKLDTTGLDFYFDGNLVKHSNYKPDFNNMYLIFNYAVGGWPGTPSTTQWANGAVEETKAEWIRVWQHAPTATTSTWTYSGGATGPWDTAGNWSGAVPNYERQQVTLPTLTGQVAMLVTWGGSRTVGSMALNGTTAYTLGQAGGTGESLMFADQLDGQSDLVVTAGNGGHVFNSRLDLWSNLSAVNNAANPVTLNGDIIGQNRLVSNRPTGGALTLSGSGDFVLNGNGFYQGSTTITGGVNVDLNGHLYYDGNAISSAIVSVNNGSRLTLANSLDSSLGGLPLDASRLVIDNGTIVVPFTRAANSRAFTIGVGGATLEVPAGFSAVFSESASYPLISVAGGGLTFGGAGTGKFYKVFSGAGSLTKHDADTWELHSNQTYSGQTVVAAGVLALFGTTGSGDTFVQSTGQLKGTGQVLANLTNDGTVSPGNSAGQLNVVGNYTQHAAGLLDIEIAGTAAGMFDVLSIAGSATLAGSLNIDLLDGFAPTAGDTFEILTASSIVGTLDLVGDSEGFSLLSTGNGLVLYFGPPLAGDYNHNGIVDAADYTVWRDTRGRIGTGIAADGTGPGGVPDGVVDQLDYDFWKANFGNHSGAGASNNTAVPEPSTLMLLALTAAGCCLRQRPAA